MANCQRFLKIKAYAALFVQFLLTAAVLICSGCNTPFSDAETPKSVLVLHSYHAGSSHTDSVMDGMEEVFSASRKNIQFDVEYLDTQRYHRPKYISEILETVFQYKMRQRFFDLVLLSDDDALNFVLKHRNDWFADTPVVFCSVSFNHPHVTSGLDKITGVLDKPSFRETIDLSLRLYPETKELVFIGCPKTVPGSFTREELQAISSEFQGRAKFTFWDDVHVEEVVDRLTRLNENTLVFIYGFICDSTGRVLSAAEGGAAISGASPVPIFSFWDVMLGNGIVGGKLVSSKMQGRLGAQLALRVLEGEDPQRIPVISVEANRYMFDYDLLRKFGISVEDLPKDRIIINRPLPFYRIAKKHLWLSLLFVAALGVTTLVLFANIRSRQRAEKELLRRQAFEKLISSISSRFIEAGPAKTDQTIDFALKALGEFAQVDRCYVFRYSPEKKTMDNTHEWCAPGIASQLGNRQGIMLNELSWVAEKLKKLEIVYVPLVAKLPPRAAAEKALLESQDIQSVLTVPITSEGTLVGVLGFDSVRSEKSWEEVDLLLLKTVGEILGNAFERHHAEKRLQSSLLEAEVARDNIDAILKSVADGLIVTDTANRVVLMNRTAEKILNVRFKDACLNRVEGIISEKAFEDHLAAVRSGAGAEPPVLLQISDRERGEVRAIQARTSIVYRKEGQPSGAVTILRDITREQEIDRMKSEFISITAHELRTPLTSILGYAELLMDEEHMAKVDDAQKKEFLSYIGEKAASLEKIIDDLLDVGRIETGRTIVLDRAPIDMHALIMDIVSHHRLETTRHDFELQFGDEPVVVEMDERRIVQVFDNLLSNAVKYSPGGGPIRIFCQVENSWVTVAVEDEGIGMSPDQVQKVFDKFYRADRSDTAVAGLGLGMSIARSIVEAHGGHIWIESQAGKGTRASFVLPLRPFQGEDKS